MMLRKSLLPFLLFLLLSGAPALAEVRWDLDLDGHLGYRVDELDWNIAGNLGGTSPNILSELTWKDLEILAVKTAADFRLTPGDFPFPICAKGSFDYGWIIDGENRDSDYAGDNRTLEYSRSENEAGDGSVVDLAVGMGMRFALNRSKTLGIIPLFGYAYRRQNLTITDGMQTVSVEAWAPGGIVAPLGPIPGLDSSYEASWHGPWIGAELEASPSEKVRLSTNAEMHFVRYRAEADWNLRADLAHPVSFRHRADGYGLVFGFDARYYPSRRFGLTGGVNYRYFHAEDGTHRVYPVWGGYADTRLNEVNWESFAAELGVQVSF